jgi:DNA-binding response OmpR family regulator
MNRTVLLVEEDEGILEILTVILVSQGIIVKPLSTAKAVLETIVDLKPSCILLDIIRVTEEGTKLCRQLKGSEATIHIPVIALSTQQEADTLKGVWANEVLLKPFEIDALITAVEKHIHIFNHQATPVLEC